MSGNQAIKTKLQLSMVALLFIPFLTSAHGQHAARAALVAFKRETAPRAASPEMVTAAVAARFPERTQKVETACALFEHTPGFWSVLANVARHRNPASVEGYWYEIAKAAAMHQRHATARNPHVVHAFGQKVSHDTAAKKREFDITVEVDGDVVFIECKNTVWSSRPKEVGAQFEDQQEIAQSRGVMYRVSSKRDVPNRWQTFFKTRGIACDVDWCE